MDVERLRSLSSQADALLNPSRHLQQQLGLESSSILKMAREAQAHARFANGFLNDIGGVDRLRALSVGVDEWRRQEQFRQLAEGSTSAMARAAQGYFGSPTMRAAMGYLDSPSFQTARAYVDSDVMRAARGLADGSTALMVRQMSERAQAFAMPEALAAFKASDRSLAERLSLFGPDLLERDALALDAFARSAAMSDALALATRVDHRLVEASRAYSTTVMPHLGSLAAHRAFLDASGLWLPRYPRVRILTIAEKRRRVRQQLKRNAAPRHVAQAKSLVHRYERVLREIIDAAMAATYGEDWASERLPACGCKTLLGRADARGGDPLDHADYAHYRSIMCHPEHFEQVFAVGFDDRGALAQLIDDAGRLRARSHHARDFAPEDMRELRLVWRTIEAGLAALINDFEVDYHD